MITRRRVADTVAEDVDCSSAKMEEPVRIRSRKLSDSDSHSFSTTKKIAYCFFYLFWFLFGLLVIRKTNNAIAAVRYVKRHGDSVSQQLIENSPEFQDLLYTLDTEFTKPPAFLLLNQYALNMTYNFLCNTAELDGVHERLVFVTLDTVARDELSKRWPSIRQFHWPTPSLYASF